MGNCLRLPVPALLHSFPSVISMIIMNSLDSISKTPYSSFILISTGRLMNSNTMYSMSTRSGVGDVPY